MRKILTGILLVLASALLCCCLTGCGGIKAGDIVKLGSYPQSISESGDVVSPIEWQVLNVENGKALIISKYGLDGVAFNSDNTKGNDWDSSELKAWLQGEFATKAGLEKHASDLTCLSFEEASQYFKDDNNRKCTPSDYAVFRGGVMQWDDNTCWWWLRSPGTLDKYRAMWVDSAGGIDDMGLMVDGYARKVGSVEFDKNITAVRPAMWVDIEELQQ